MVYIGCHLTVTNGYEAMGHQMVDLVVIPLRGLPEIQEVASPKI